MSNPLGKFELIPPEIREAMWSLLVPEGYGQYHRFDTATDKLTRVPHPYSELTAFALVSKVLRSEFLGSMFARRRAEIEIYIHPNGFTTNFPVTVPGTTIMTLSPSSNDSSNPITLLPACKAVTITIDILAPRAAPNAIATRRVVNLIVKSLNEQPSNGLPHITVQLVVAPGHSITNCTVNDFAVLVGPFAKLKKASNGFKIMHFPRVMMNHEKLARQCEMIEESAVTKAVGYGLAYQQLMLDIKLPLCSIPRYAIFSQIPIPTNPRTKREALGVLEAVQKLRRWYKQMRVAEPEWVEELGGELEAGMTMPQLESGLVVRILDGERIPEMCYWVAGFLTITDPFRCVLA